MGRSFYDTQGVYNRNIPKYLKFIATIHPIMRDNRNI